MVPHAIRRYRRIFAPACALLALPLWAETLYYEGDGTATSLLFPEVLTSNGGNTVATAGGTITSGATFGLGQTLGGAASDSTFWLSFIGYRTTTATTDGSANAFNLSLGTDDRNDIIGVGGYRGYTAGKGNYVVADGTSTSANNVNNWTLTALDGTTQDGIRTGVSAVSSSASGADFILLKIDYNQATGSDTLSLWINPSLAAGEDGLAAQTYFEMTGLDLAAFDQVRLYTGANAVFTVDEIRLATSFETAIPETSSLALLFGAGAGVFALHRRRTRRGQPVSS